MATRGRPPTPERHYLDPAFKNKRRLNTDGSPYRAPLGRPAGLTLATGLICDMVLVIGMAEYFFYQAKERGAPITIRAAFERGIQEILAYYSLRPSRAKQLAETAMRKRRKMVGDLGLLPIK
jgi:hypothetical protein